MNDAPAHRRATVRQALERALLEEALTLRELSQRVGVSEKQLGEHLEHLAKSLKSRGLRLLREPAHCLACGFLFRDRQRMTAPSRCPQCKSERVEPATFRLVGG